MGYIKVAYQEILNELDNNYNLPDDWNKFVDEQTVTQNLIIKSSKSSVIVQIAEIHLPAIKK